MCKASFWNRLADEDQSRRHYWRLLHMQHTGSFSLLYALFYADHWLIASFWLFHNYWSYEISLFCKLSERHSGLRYNQAANTPIMLRGSFFMGTCWHLLWLSCALVRYVFHKVSKLRQTSKRLRFFFSVFQFTVTWLQRNCFENFTSLPVRTVN